MSLPPPHHNPNAQANPLRMVSKIELFVECKGLKNMDLLSKSDPLCALYTLDPRKRQWRMKSKTERIKDNLNPKFVKSFEVEYHFEQNQPLKFAVYDIDSKDQSLKKADFIGDMNCTLGEIMGSRGSAITRTLKNKKGKRTGEITIKAEEKSTCRDNVVLQFYGKKLPKMDLFSSDPYLVMSRISESGGSLVAHKTEVIKMNRNPKWKRFKISVQKLAGGDYDRPILFQCYDWDRTSSDDLIGSFQASLKDLQSKKEFILRHPKKKKTRGKIIVQTIAIQRNYSFVEYLQGGLDINLHIAVDFTRSNGVPEHPKSLHNRSVPGGNPYEQVIRQVGSILNYYDSDKQIDAYGYGAKIFNGAQYAVSHCFALNGNQSNPFCSGVDGVLHAYRSALNNVQLYGPTLLSPILSTTNGQIRSQNANDHSYHILLVITDGVLNDLDSTIEKICSGSRLPLSIVICGVGNADFRDMDRLDSDDQLLRIGNSVACRDIVQFVPFNRFKGVNQSTRLAQEVLAEIPDQVVQYYKMKGIRPKPRVQYKAQPAFQFRQFAQAKPQSQPQVPPVQNQQLFSGFRQQRPSQQHQPQQAPPSYNQMQQRPPQGGYNQQPPPNYPQQQPPQSFQNSQYSNHHHTQYHNQFGGFAQKQNAPYPSNQPQGNTPYPTNNQGGNAPYPKNNQMFGNFAQRR